MKLGKPSIKGVTKAVNKAGTDINKEVNRGAKAAVKQVESAPKKLKKTATRAKKMSIPSVRKDIRKAGGDISTAGKKAGGDIATAATVARQDVFNAGRPGDHGTPQNDVAPAPAPAAPAPPPPPQMAAVAPWVNPYTDAIKNLESSQYGGKLSLLANPEDQLAQNYNAQRQMAIQSANAASQSGLATAGAGIAATTGLSEADRRALAAQGHRAKISSLQGAQNPYDQLQSQSIADTDKFNIGRRQTTADANTQLKNTYEQEKSAFEQRKQENLYQLAIKAAEDKRRIETAEMMAQRQG
jgi:hypothetical protein